MSDCRKKKDDCKPREKKCDRHHGHHGDRRKKCAPKKPWCPPVRSGGQGHGQGHGRV